MYSIRRKRLHGTRALYCTLSLSRSSLVSHLIVVTSVAYTGNIFCVNRSSLNRLSLSRFLSLSLSLSLSPYNETALFSINVLQLFNFYPYSGASSIHNKTRLFQAVPTSAIKTKLKLKLQTLSWNKSAPALKQKLKTNVSILNMHAHNNVAEWSF